MAGRHAEIDRSLPDRTPQPCCAHLQRLPTRSSGKALCLAVHVHVVRLYVYAVCLFVSCFVKHTSAYPSEPSSLVVRTFKHSPHAPRVNQSVFLCICVSSVCTCVCCRPVCILLCKAHKMFTYIQTGSQPMNCVWRTLWGFI